MPSRGAHATTYQLKEFAVFARIGFNPEIPSLPRKIPTRHQCRTLGLFHLHDQECFLIDQMKQ